MSRAALTTAFLWLLTGSFLPLAAQGVDPHISASSVTGGCSACHQGHGASRSPMLPTTQVALCLRCHGTRAGLDQEVMRGRVSANAQPRLLDSVLSLPSVHPLDESAYSRRQPRSVTCTSCHSPHRAMAETSGNLREIPGRRKVSPRDPNRFEFELCQECHGSGGAASVDPTDLSRLLDPSSRSYHPVQTVAMERSSSIVPRLRGREINCTDCHGAGSPSAPQGPHGSRFNDLLRAQYTRTDGEESEQAYALCYTCHQREVLLDEERSEFPEHRRHVVGEQTACSTCHNPHGAVGNRGLIRFGEETRASGAVLPSSSGVLRFESAFPGSGKCYLTCHGVDHDPEPYGLEIDIGDPPMGPPPMPFPVGPPPGGGGGG